MTFDLHTHTAFSDGTSSPDELAAMASRLGLSGLALTDHDTAEGWPQMAQACRQRGLGFVPGIELSTERQRLSVHVLGYWVDPEDPDLLAECHRLRNERALRADAIVGKLQALGSTVTLGAVQAFAGDAPIGRPHIAQAMVQAGTVGDLQTAFDVYLADSGPAYVPKYAVDPEEGVRLIRAAGGVAVLAHPGVSENRDGGVTPDLFARMVAAGLGGIEVDTPAHDEEMRATWLHAAREAELVVTGASDYHGDNKTVEVGARTTPRQVVDSLAERADNHG